MSAAGSPVTLDAVVIVPGIMGSELVERGSGRVLWGASKPAWYVDAWLTGRSLRKLQLDPDDLDGAEASVKPTRLLRFPSVAPLLQGFEPYTKLLKSVTTLVAHPRAVAEFPYDWRLSVRHNAQKLAAAANDHLARWQSDEANAAARKGRPDLPETKLVIVAHSMGGLLAHRWLRNERPDHVRGLITIGSPFLGAPTVVKLLESGDGAPISLPRRRLRALTSSLPGVYDLLPWYRCVDEGNTARHLNGGDISAIGANRALFAVAARDRLDVRGAVDTTHHQIVGVSQPTYQSLLVRDGAVTLQQFTCHPAAEGMVRLDYGGDGTVHRESASIGSSNVVPVGQSHGALARVTESINTVTDILLSRQRGPWLGGAELGLKVPDVTRVGEQCVVEVTGVELPTDCGITVEDCETGQLVDRPTPSRRDGRIVAKVRGNAPGMYRVGVTGGGQSSVSQILLALPPTG